MLVSSYFYVRFFVVWTSSEKPFSLRHACTGSLAARRSCAWNEHLPKAAATAHLDAHSSSLDIEVVDKRNGNKVRARRCRPIPFSLPSIYAKLIFQYVSIICLVRDVSNCSRFARRNFLPPCVLISLLHFSLQISAASRNRRLHLRHMVSTNPGRNVFKTPFFCASHVPKIK